MATKGTYDMLATKKSVRIGTFALTLLLAIGRIMVLPSLSGAVPASINYQGFLTDNSNAPVTGSFPMTFALYPDSLTGSAVWTESYASVSVTAGVFNVILGTPTPLPPAVFTGAQLWLQTTVNGNALTPRRPLVSVAYAFRANIADATVSGGDLLWTASGSFIYSKSEVHADSGLVVYGGLGGSAALEVQAVNNTGGGAVHATYNRSDSPAVYGHNTVATGGANGGGAGVFGETDSSSPNAEGVYGLAGHGGIGVHGSSGSGGGLAGRFDGDVAVYGATRLGSASSGAPAIMMKKVVGTTAASDGAAVSINTGIADDSKIIAISVMVEFDTNRYVAPGYTVNPGYEYSWHTNLGQVVVWLKSGNSANLLNKRVKILITYEE